MKKGTVFVTILLLFLFFENSGTAKASYKTYDVVGVMEKHIVIKRKGGEKIVIERARRPYLEVGDKVRYDKKRNRLRKTIKKKD